MQIKMGGRLTIDLLEESQELVCPMARHTFADDRTMREKRLQTSRMQSRTCRGECAGTSQ